MKIISNTNIISLYNYLKPPTNRLSYLYLFTTDLYSIHVLVSFQSSNITEHSLEDQEVRNKGTRDRYTISHHAYFWTSFFVASIIMMTMSAVRATAITWRPRPLPASKPHDQVSRNTCKLFLPGSACSPWWDHSQVRWVTFFDI